MKKLRVVLISLLLLVAILLFLRYFTHVGSITSAQAQPKAKEYECNPVFAPSDAKYRTLMAGAGSDYTLCVVPGPGSTFVIDYVSGQAGFDNDDLPEPPALEMYFSGSVHVIPTRIAFQQVTPVHRFSYAFSERVEVPVDFNTKVMFRPISTAKLRGAQISVTGHYE